MNKTKTTILIIILTIIFGLIGQLVGGFVFFNLVHIDDYSYLGITTLYQYGVAYKNQLPIFRFVVLGAFVSAFITILPILFTIALFWGNKKISSHGEARFANDIELSKSGLLPTLKQEKTEKYPYILLGKISEGKHTGKFLKYYGQQFVALAAPTRSGKGVGIMIPNLLTYSGSIAVLDIKLENFKYSAGYREKVLKQKVFLFCPDGYADSTNEKDQGILKGHRYNPLFYIRRLDVYREGDILEIAKVIYPTTGDGDKDTWPNLATALFTGLVLYMLDRERVEPNYPVNLPHLYKMTAPDGGLAKWMQTELSRNKTENFLSKECILQFNSFIDNSERTQSSIISTLTSPLQIFSTQTVAMATSGNDFDFRQFRKEKISLYIGLEPSGLKKYRLLVNLLFSQMINENTRTLPEMDSTLKYQLLLMLDEFTAMGRVDIIKDAVGYTAGYNVRYMFIFQNISQMEDDALYGVQGTRTILENCDVKLIYPPKDAASNEAENLSKTLGTFTLKVKSKSKSKGGNSTSESEQERALMKPQEIVELGYIKFKETQFQLKEIVIAGGIRPFIAEKIVYFDMPEFDDKKSFSLSNVPSIPLLKLTVDNTMEKTENVYIPKIKESV